MHEPHRPERTGTVDSMSTSETSPTVTEVLRFEDLPLGSRGTRRAVVRWSDGSEGEALTWYADEILVCEGDLIVKTREQLRSLHFRIASVSKEPSCGSCLAAADARTLTVWHCRWTTFTSTWTAIAPRVRLGLVGSSGAGDAIASATRATGCAPRLAMDGAGT
jgi:hypothetical protein